MDTPRELAPPERFELGAPLGRGAVGVVHRAWDRVLGREVALKLLLVDRPTATQMERFRREGELARAIDHPNVVRLLAAGTCQGRPCLAFELVERARTLRAALPELSQRQVLELLRDVAHALGTAHAAAVVHRDVKLDNMLLDAEGRVKVTDFGVATAAHLARLTRSGAIVGTPHALAPEQVEAGTVSPATDVWALGIALHEALLGEAPFQGEEMLQLLQQIVDAPLPSLRRRGLDAGLAAIVERCLQKEPGRRYPNGEAVAVALEGWLAGKRPRAARRGLAPVLISLLLLLGGVVVAGLVVHQRAQRREAACAALSSAVWAALGSGSSVAAASSQLAAREAEARTLGGSGPELARAREGLALTRALAALGAGDAEAARAAAAGASGPGADALQGALAALEPAGDAEAAWSALTRAIAADVAPDELRLWRARAALRLAEPGPERLAAVLADLADLGPDLDRAGQLVRAELALRAGDLELVRSCLTRVSDPPPALGWRLVLAEAWRGDPLLDAPERLAARLEALGPDGRPETPALRLLAQEVEARFRAATQRLERRGDGRPLTVAQRTHLLALARVHLALGGTLGTQALLFLWEGSLETEAAPQLEHLRLLRQVRELCPAEVVDALWGPAVQQLAQYALAVGGGAPLEGMVAEVPEPWLQSRVRFFRGVDRRAKGRWAEAREDLRAVEAWLEDPRLLALWEHPSFPGAARSEVSYNLALVAEQLDDGAEAVRQGFQALRSTHLGIHIAGGVEIFSLEGVVDLLWRRCFPGNPKLAREALELRMKDGVTRAHNWVRLARLELLAGDPLLAESRLSPVEALTGGEGPVRQALLAAHQALQVEGAPDGDARLRELEALLR